MLRHITRVFLILTLLAGWQAALQHPIEHVSHAGGFVHAAGDNHGSSDNTPLCDALDALTACVSGATTLIAARFPDT